jgi:hypothetical protein
MNWQIIIGLIAGLAFFSPAIILLVYQLVRNKYFGALFLYLLLAFISNLMSCNILEVPKSFVRTYGIINNLLDVPLMMIFLMFFSLKAAFRTRMKMLLGIYLVFELVIVYLTGLEVLTIAIVMGPGLAMVFGYTLYFFAQSVKKSFIHNKFISRAIMASALCFGYGCFIFIYLMHYIMAVKGLPEIFLLYYIVITVFGALLTAGLVFEGKRKRYQEELLVTRRELLSFFADEKKQVIPNNITGMFKTEPN